MSSFNAPTRHPVTGKVEYALWIDDYFGRHCYGVVFPDSTVAYDPEEYDLKPIRPPEVATPPAKPERRPALMCVRCGSNSITETWQPGVLECMNCGAKGQKG